MRMSPCARRGILEALLRVVAISVITVNWTQGQVTSFGGCPNYQTSIAFDKTFNESLIAETTGYKILMTTDRPNAGGCYLFKFLADQLFRVEYVDSNYDQVTNEGGFYFSPRTFSDSGSIYLGLAPSVLGAGPFGGTRLYVIYVETGYFVAISCGTSFGFFKTEHVHVFAKASAMAALTPTIAAINTTLETAGIPHAKMFRPVDQTCTKPTPRQTPQFFSNYGAVVPVGTYPGNVNPASPLQFLFGAGAAVPVWSVPGQVGSYPGIRHPGSAAGPGQIQPFYHDDTARPAVGFSSPNVFQTPNFWLQNF